MKYTIPFVLWNRKGVLAIEYDVNTSVVDSGMDILDGLGFDPAVCIGYPTMHAYIAAYEGTGYRMYMYFVQLIYLSIFDKHTDKAPQKTETIIDTLPELRDKVPFCASGCRPSFYDAPSFAEILGEKVVFQANTYLVAPPTPKEGVIKRLCGFSWGHIEDTTDKDNRLVDILPLEVTGKQEWRRDIVVLNDAYPGWEFI